MKRIVLIVFVFLSFMNCVSAQQELEDLQAVPNPRLIKLNERISRLLGRERTLEQGLLPDEYIGKRENASGTFFESSNPVFYERRLPDGKLTLRKGGFWIPKSSADKPRLFYIFEPTTYEASSVDVAVNNITSFGTKNPATGQVGNTPSSIGVNALGAAIASSIVSLIIESGRGKIMFLGAIPDDILPEKLARLATPDLENELKKE